MEFGGTEITPHAKIPSYPSTCCLIKRAHSSLATKIKINSLPRWAAETSVHLSNKPPPQSMACGRQRMLWTRTVVYTVDLALIYSKVSEQH